MTQQHQQQATEEARPMEVEPAHVMTREKHKQREHYEAMLQEIEIDQLDKKNGRVVARPKNHFR